MSGFRRSHMIMHIGGKGWCKYLHIDSAMWFGSYFCCSFCMYNTLGEVASYGSIFTTA